MTHGVQGFFVERGRAIRRVAMISLGLGFGGLVPLLLLSLPRFYPMRKMIVEAVRFGYEGPDQLVRRISLEQVRGSHTVSREVGSIAPFHGKTGGGRRNPILKDLRADPVVRPDPFGPGLSDADLLQRAVSRIADIPVVQSEDLIIEHAATPVYPEGEVERGVEGRVMVQALIDTTGRVVDVQLLASTGVETFERSAAEAVWQYRFHPYRPGGVTREVYAVFRFSFRIY